MAQTSNIAWTNATWNPVIGCTKVSAACDFCYAEEYVNRYEPLVQWGKPGQKSKLRRTSPSTWDNPRKWNNAAGKAQTPLRVFTCSLSDFFDSDWDPQWRAEAWDVIRATPWLDWMVLTKRPQNISKMLPEDWGSGWRNVWLGTTAENQEEYDRRRLHLLRVPAWAYFFSVEPMLGPVVRDVVHELGKNVMYICGGESGHNHRLMDLAWAESLRQSCARNNVRFFFKQVSSVKPGMRGNAPDTLWNAREFCYSWDRTDLKEQPPMNKAQLDALLL